MSIGKSLSVMSGYIFLQTPVQTSPLTSHFLTSVPSSMLWERKEWQRSPTCPCCVALHWCCGCQHNILRLPRFLPSTSFHQRGLAGNCLAECSQRLESKTWRGCVTEVTSDRPRPCFHHQLNVWEGSPFISLTFSFIFVFQQAHPKKLLPFPNNSVLL